MSESKQQVPSVGCVVHVVTFEGQHRPAHVLDPQDGQTICVLALVKPWDQIADSGTNAGAVLWLLDNCEHDPTGQQPATRHWPEFVPPKDDGRRDYGTSDHPMTKAEADAEPRVSGETGA